MDSIPLLQIGAADGDSTNTFGSIAGIAQFSDGPIVVLDSYDHKLKYFDADGTFRRLAGSQGAGPGEFRDPNWMAICGGDSISVYDWTNKRISIFDRNGAFHRSSAHPGRTLTAISCTSDGSILHTTRISGPVDLPIGPHRDNADVRLLSPEGNLSLHLGEFPGSDRYRFERSDMPRDLGKELAIALSQDRIYVGSADRYEIEIYSRAGEPVGRMHWQGRSLSVSSDDWARYTKERLKKAPDGQPRQILARFYRTSSQPEFFPAYRRFLLDERGNLWVEEYPRPADDRTSWYVFDPNGTSLGKIHMPASFTVYQIGKDFVLGKWQDSLGVHFVRRYRLIKDGSG